MAIPVDQPRGVWITRTAPGAEATAKRVAALGLDPIVAPLLMIKPQAAAVELEPFEAVAATSAQALLNLPAGIPRDRRLFAVGDATARAARRAGFTDVLCAGGDVKALAALILKTRPLAVAHLSAETWAGDLVGPLTEAGIPARRVTVYRAEPVKTLPAAPAQAMAAGALLALLVHSPRAALIAATLIAREGMAVGGVEALGLSPACIRPLAKTGFRRLRAAAAPNEAALLALLAVLVQDARHG